MPRLLGPIDCAYIIYKLNWVNKEEEEEVEGRKRGIRIGFVICYVYGERKDETMIVHDQQHIRSNMLKPNNYISGESDQWSANNANWKFHIIIFMEIHSKTHKLTGKEYGVSRIGN